MRLIDADELIEEINSYQYDTVNSEIRKIEHTVKAHICELVEKQPTAYDMDKVVERLEELINKEYEKESNCDENGFCDGEEIFDDGVMQGRYEAYRKSLEIVKSGGIDKA